MINILLRLAMKRNVISILILNVA